MCGVDEEQLLKIRNAAQMSFCDWLDVAAGLFNFHSIDDKFISELNSIVLSGRDSDPR